MIQVQTAIARLLCLTFHTASTLSLHVSLSVLIFDLKVTVDLGLSGKLTEWVGKINISVHI